VNLRSFLRRGTGLHSNLSEMTSRLNSRRMMTSKIREITIFLCFCQHNNRRNRFLCYNNYYYYFSLLVYVIIIIIMIIIIAITMISNGNRGEWSTIEGVIGRVISKSASRYALGYRKENPVRKSQPLVLPEG